MINEEGLKAFLAKKKIDKQVREKIVSEFYNFLECPTDFISDLQTMLLQETVGALTEETLAFVSWLGFADFTEYQIKKAVSFYSLEDFKKDPYCLVEIDGVPFSKLEKLGHVFKVAEDDPLRQEALIIYILKTCCFTNGHLFLTSIQILTFLEELGGNQFFQYTSSLDVSDILHICDRLRFKNKIVIEDDAIYPKNAYVAEDDSVKLLSKFVNKDILPVDLDTVLNSFTNCNLSTEQIEAVKLVSENQACVITGLPGVGKSLLTAVIVEMCKTLKKTFKLFSPTGIAAKNLSSFTKEEAYTIHRGLGYKGDTWVFNEFNKLDVDVVIVDEVSMVDQFVFSALLKALPSTCRLVLIGDYNQLPSVGPGNVLKELVSTSIPKIHLSKIFRQKEGSRLLTNAHAINNGQNIEVNNSDFVFVRSKDNDFILQKIILLVEALYNKKADFQVITPTHKGTLGTKNLNYHIRERVNPQGISAKIGNKWFRVNDKIMFIKNDYDNNVFNGDMGVIRSIKRDGSTFDFVVEIIDKLPRTITIRGDSLKNIVLAYAVTVHKSQGSEFSVIIMPLIKWFGIQLERNLFYTAVTRAKNKMILFGEDAAVSKAIKTVRAINRNTKFGEKMEDELKCN